MLRVYAACAAVPVLQQCEVPVNTSKVHPMLETSSRCNIRTWAALTKCKPPRHLCLCKNASHHSGYLRLVGSRIKPHVFHQPGGRSPVSMCFLDAVGGMPRSMQPCGCLDIADSFSMCLLETRFHQRLQLNGRFYNPCAAH